MGKYDFSKELDAEIDGIYRKNKRKFIILTDMDDTIEDLLSAWTACLNKRHNLNVSKEDIKEWELTAAFPSLSYDEVHAPLYENSLWETVKPMKDASLVLEMLQTDGHEIFVVTSTNYQTLPAKMEHVLFKYFPFIDWRHVIVTTNKQMIKGDILIDDAPHNLVGGEYYKIMMEAPHNICFDASSIGAIRVHSWKEVYGVITSLSEIQREEGGAK